MQYLDAISKMTMISVHFQDKPFNITVIQVYAPTTNAEETEVAPSYCVLNSFIDYEGYSISFKEFFPIVVDTVVI